MEVIKINPPRSWVNKYGADEANKMFIEFQSKRPKKGEVKRKKGKENTFSLEAIRYRVDRARQDINDAIATHRISNIRWEVDQKLGERGYILNKNYFNRKLTTPKNYGVIKGTNRVTSEKYKKKPKSEGVSKKKKKSVKKEPVKKEKKSVKKEPAKTQKAVVIQASASKEPGVKRVVKVIPVAELKGMTKKQQKEAVKDVKNRIVVTGLPPQKKASVKKSSTKAAPPAKVKKEKTPKITLINSTKPTSTITAPKGKAKTVDAMTTEMVGIAPKVAANPRGAGKAKAAVLQVKLENNEKVLTPKIKLVKPGNSPKGGGIQKKKKTSKK